MLATLLLELGLPEAPHSDCGRWKVAFPRCVEEVFARNGLEFEGVRPMGSLRRLAFLVEGIPTSVGAHQIWVDGPMVRVGRAPDGRFTPVAIRFAERVGKAPTELEVREREGVQRFGATVSRSAALTASVLPTLLPELLDRLAASDRNNAAKGMALNDALRWIVALFGDSRVRFRWANVQSDRYTYKTANKQDRIAVPHFYEYHATLAQAGIRVDEATRRDHIVQQLNAAAADFGGRCVIAERQLEQLSQRLDRPVVHLRRGLPQVLNAGFVEALAAASISCVPVVRDGGALAPGWLVVSDEEASLDGEAPESITPSLFERCLANAAEWVARREPVVARREHERMFSSLADALDPVFRPLPKERLACFQALWLCRWAEETLVHSCFPGVELQLSLQRALRPKVSPRVGTILEALCHYLSPAPEEALRSSAADQRLTQKAFIMLALARLTDGFGQHQAPVGERDPLGLRLLAERLFEVLISGEWDLPMLGACRVAHVALCGPGTDKDPQTEVWDDEGALAAFLRHRFRRFVERVDPALPRNIPSSGEWSALAVWRRRAVNPKSNPASSRRRTVTRTTKR
jgi:glycyl-tRNA synthetase beta subunit